MQILALFFTILIINLLIADSVLGTVLNYLHILPPLDQYCCDLNTTGAIPIFQMRKL